MAATDVGDGQTDHSVLECGLGDSTRVRVLQFLAENDGTYQQKEIAEKIGASETMVSRAKGPLVDAGLVEEVDGGLSTSSGVSSAISSLESAARS